MMYFHFGHHLEHFLFRHVPIRTAGGELRELRLRLSLTLRCVYTQSWLLL